MQTSNLAKQHLAIKHAIEITFIASRRRKSIKDENGEKCNVNGIVNVNSTIALSAPSSRKSTTTTYLPFQDLNLARSTHRTTDTYYVGCTYPARKEMSPTPPNAPAHHAFPNAVGKTGPPCRLAENTPNDQGKNGATRNTFLRLAEK